MFHTQIPLLFNRIFVRNPSHRCIEKFGCFSSFPKGSYLTNKQTNKAKFFLWRNPELLTGPVCFIDIRCRAPCRVNVYLLTGATKEDAFTSMPTQGRDEMVALLVNVLSILPVLAK